MTLEENSHSTGDAVESANNAPARLNKVFLSIANQMREEFEQSSLAMSHPGEKGSAREETLRKFLRERLPNHLDITSGFCVDPTGEQSRQQDVVISDAQLTPVLYESSGTRVLPIEPVYAAVEVKSRLDRDAVSEAVEKMLSIKRLTKSALYEQRGPVSYYHEHYGRQSDIWPTMFFVFAYSGTDLQLIIEELLHQQMDLDLPVEERIDTVCVLDQGVITNRHADGTIGPLPAEDSRLTAGGTKNPLLLFYTLLAHVMLQAQMHRRFRFTDYIRGLSFD